MMLRPGERLFVPVRLPRSLSSGKFCQAPRHNLVVFQFECDVATDLAAANQTTR
jgi:hypothetical protein